MSSLIVKDTVVIIVIITHLYENNVTSSDGTFTTYVCSDPKD